MVERRVDNALRALRTGSTRRQGLAAMLGALFGGARLANASGSATDRSLRPRGEPGSRDRQRRRPNPEGPCGDGSRAANICAKNSQCCTGVCNTKAGRKNIDGQGRCRCLKKGKACSASRNCCNEMTCYQGVCSRGCNPVACPNGCCDGATCVAGTSGLACGAGGAACITCSSLTAVCASAVCTPGTWEYQTQIGTEGAGDTNLELPYGVAVSPDTLTLWIADTANHRIVIWTRPDAASTVWTYHAQFGSAGAGDTNLSGPHGIAVSPDGLTIWVTDHVNNRIVIWSRPDAASTAWNYLAQFGSTGTGDENLDSPSTIALSPDLLTAWVADKNNNRIVIWSRPDANSTTWTYHAQFGTLGSGDTNLNRPRSVFVSPDTLTAWVADSFNNRIVTWTRSNAASTAWNYLAQFGTVGAGDSNFTKPHDVVLSPDLLTAWVVDYGNDRIAIWTRPNAASTAWAYHAQFGSDGAGDTNFSNPTSIAISPDTVTAWIADSGNDRVVIWKQA
jgi:DNA-binding beta-propeller fold protein YncE